MGRRSSSTQTSIRIASPSPQTYERGPREDWGEGVCDAPHWGFCRGRLRGLGRATLDARKVTSTLINLGVAGNNNSREGPPCMCPFGVTLGAWGWVYLSDCHGGSVVIDESVPAHFGSTHVMINYTPAIRTLRRDGSGAPAGAKCKQFACSISTRSSSCGIVGLAPIPIASIAQDPGRP